MALAWKAGWVNALAGSNPASSAVDCYLSAAMTPLRDFHDITERIEAPDMTDPALAKEAMDPIEANDATENADAVDPILPIDRNDPTEPMDKTEPLDPMHKKESWERNDSLEVGIAPSWRKLSRNSPRRTPGCLLGRRTTWRGT